MAMEHHRTSCALATGRCFAKRDSWGEEALRVQEGVVREHQEGAGQ